MVTLGRLSEAVQGAQIVGGSADVSLSGLTYDSRQVTPGVLFIAVSGERHDGHQFIPAVVAAGASAVVVQQGREGEFAGLPVPRLVVPDSRKAMAPLACRFYDNPTHRLYLAGVTGTNGKTTTARMIDAIARAAGDTTGVVGTLGATVAGRDLPGDRTTPEAPDLQKLFSEMLAAGAKSAAMEVASHALVLGRTEGCAYDVALFTNLTQDHLDFHGTMESYRDAKGTLFTDYADTAKAAGKEMIAVLNVADEAGRHYKGLTRASRTVTYAADHTADIRPENLKTGIGSIEYTAKTPVGDVEVNLRFGGFFNVANSLAAVGYGVARGLSAEVIADGLAQCPPVPGRFQPVNNELEYGVGYTVLVDYAHTPDGLENVLLSVRRSQTHGRLIVVFGCGGNRDRTKRPIMGGIAKRLAKIAIVTSDNPRREEPESIINEILTGMTGSGAEVHRESDRRKAIALAVELAQPNDVVVIAGKGHEDYQIIGDQTFPFDDVAVAREEIERCSAH